jgi:hypothetical protein
MSAYAFEECVKDGMIRLPAALSVLSGDKVHVIVWKDEKAVDGKDDDIFDELMAQPLPAREFLGRDEIYNDR